MRFINFQAILTHFKKKSVEMDKGRRGVHVHVATSNDKTPLNDIKYLYRLLQGYTSSGDSGIESSLLTDICLRFLVTQDNILTNTLGKHKLNYKNVE